MRKNYLKNVALLMGLLLPLSVMAVNVGKKTKAVYSYGAMDSVYSVTPTSVVRSYYDVNNRLARVVEADIMLADHDQTLEVEYPGQEVPRLYSIYDYDANGQLLKVRTRKYGLYSGHDKAWAGFVDAETYEYDADGNMVKKTDVTYITHYVWENGNLKEEIAYYTADGKWSSTIKYISFAEDEVNMPTAALFSDKWKNAWYYEYEYDKAGNKTVSSQYKVKNAEKDENGVVIGGEKGVMYAQTISTYVDGVLTEQLNGFWNNSADSLNPDSKTVYAVSGDTTAVSNYRYYNGKWSVFGGVKKHVAGVVDNATAPTGLSVKKVANTTNTLQLTATAPANATSEGWNVYRNGMLVGEARLADGLLTYQDTLVKNGAWDYFIQQGDGNTSEVVEVTLDTELPAIDGVKILKNSANATGDYEVIIAWTKPNTTLPILGYNVYADIQDYETNPIPENGTSAIPVEVTTDTLVWLAAEENLNRTIHIEVVYNIGKVKGQAIPVVLQKEELPLMTKVIMTMGDAMGMGSDNSASKAEVYYYDNTNKLARKMIYGKLTGTDPDDPDQIYGAGDWIPMTYTAYDYNEKGQLVKTRFRQYGVFSGYNRAWNEFEEEGAFGYDEEGRMTNGSYEANRMYYYKYDGDNVIQETYSNNSGIIIYHKYYSNFVEGLVNCPQYAFANSPYGLTTNDRIYEYSYDKEGRMDTCRVYKYDNSTIIKDDEGNVIGAEKGTPDYEEIWTYEDGILLKYEKNVWKSGKKAYEGKTRTEYTLTPMGTQAVTWSYSVGIWAKGGTSQVTWDVPFSGKSISNLEAKMVEGKVNTVELTAEAPAGYPNNTVWNVFRNGSKIGQATAKRTSLSFVDENVPNGHWDYFIQVEDQHTAMGVNVSNVVELDIYTELPPVTDIRVVSNQLNEVKDYELVLEWDAPQTDLTLKGYNMFVDVLDITKNPSPVNGIHPFTSTTYTYTAATDVKPEKEFMVEAVYNIGKVKSAVLAVVLSKENQEGPGGSQGVETVTAANVLFMVGDVLVVNGEYNSLEIVGMNGANVGTYCDLRHINLSNVPSGIYAVRLNKADGVWSGKIVVK